MRSCSSLSPFSTARLCGALIFVASLCALGMPVNAANTSFAGPLSIIFEDDGTGRYAGAMEGDPFFGQFSYGDFASQAFEITIEPNETGWEFLGFPVSLSNGVTSITGGESFVNIQDNFALDAEEAALATLLLGMPISAGTLGDSWSVSGLEAGAFEADPDPFDGDDEELVFNGILFDVVYFSLDTSLINGLAYDPIPPGLNEADFAFFTIVEGDSDGNVIFQALGIVETTVIPVPAAAWLFGSALGLLGLLRRRLTSK